MQKQIRKISFGTVLLLSMLLQTTMTTKISAQFKAMAGPVKPDKQAKALLEKQKTNISVPFVIDTTNIYSKMMNDESDDLMEDHPAEDLYNHIWTHYGINPYKGCTEKIPDTIKIDMSAFVIPVKSYVVTSNYGRRRYRFHHGIDLGLHTGDTIVSAFSGKVRIVRYEPRGYGNYVVVRHDNGLETVYAHLSKSLVESDQVVEAGEVIGLGGNTGRSTGPHLHFETRFIGNSLDPKSLIDFKEKKAIAETFVLPKKKLYYQHKSKTRTYAKYYRVRAGDVLSKIAVRNRTSVKKLKRLNRLRSSKIRMGQRLRIR